MCGLAGFSLQEGSEINPRELANAMLSEIEWRGTHASGFAWTEGEKRGWYKDDVPGSQLSLKSMPKTARNVILHTRFATQGHQSDNRNNHPVLSPSGGILLTHNGMISNDHVIRRSALADSPSLAEVDTAVIPALLEKMSVQAAVDEMEGYAACAWFDTRTEGVIHLSRFNSSPVAYGWLVDGSFVYASTEDLLAKALMRIGAQWVGSYPKTFESMFEGEYITIDNGLIYDQVPIDGDSMDSFEWARGGFSSVRALSGGHGSEDRPAVLTDNPADAKWWQEQFAEEEEELEGELVVERYYTLDHEGDYAGYTSLDSLTNALLWWGGMTVKDDDLKTDGDDRWVNYFSDVGELNDDGSLISWVDTPEFTYAHEVAEGEPILDFVRSGIQYLRTVLAG